MTITNGRDDGTQFGIGASGGVANLASLTLNDVKVTGNTATQTTPAGTTRSQRRVASATRCS